VGLGASGFGYDVHFVAARGEAPSLERRLRRETALRRVRRIFARHQRDSHGLLRAWKSSRAVASSRSAWYRSRLAITHRLSERSILASSQSIAAMSRRS